MPLKNTAKVLDLHWDMDSESVAILQRTYTIVVWTPGTKSVTEIDMPSPKDFASYIQWSATQPVLAIGTEKGSLVFFNKKNQRKIPCVGKHSKKVNTGAWNQEGLLISGAEDKILTVSNSTGDTVLDSFIVKGKPFGLKWARTKKEPEEDQKEHEISAVMDRKYIIIIHIETTHNVEISFSQAYGKLVDYDWFGDGYIASTFTNGIISIISTHKKEIGMEIQSLNVFNGAIEAMAVSESLCKMAVAAHGTIKIINMNDWVEVKGEQITIPHDIGKITKLEWTTDGQILTVSTSNGYLCGYLMIIPSLTSSYFSNVAMLSSLSEVSIIDCLRNYLPVAKISLDIEPGFLALGARHCAVGINNSIWYYKWMDEESGEITETQLVCKREYFGTITQVALNSNWTAVLSEGKCTLHLIEADLYKGQNVDDRKFPQNESDGPITSIHLTEDFLVLVDKAGRIKYYLVEENTVVSEYRPENPVLKIFPNHSGTKSICIDNTGCGYLYNPVDDSIALIPNFNATVKNVVWDIDSPNVFATVEPTKMNTYLYLQTSLEGPTIIHLPRYSKLEDVNQVCDGIVTNITDDLTPIVLKTGYIYSHSKSEGMRGDYLSTHSYISSWRGSNDSEEGHTSYFLQNLAIHRFAQCFEVAKVCEETLAQQMYEALGKFCLKNIEIPHAETAFRLCRNVGMVFAVQQMKEETEKYILMGHISSLLHKQDQAQEAYLKSSRPELALEMRCDLQDWFTALKLTQSIDPN